MTDKNFIDLSGEYIVNGYDIHDGPFRGSRLIMALDEKCSHFAQGHIAYTSTAFFNDGTETYHGAIIANGNHFAMSFKNIIPGQESDHGVLFGTVTHAQDERGQYQTQLHVNYYQPDYKGGGYGTGVNIKKVSL